MEDKFKKITGYSLILGSVLLIFAMTFHPTGGSIENILNTKALFISSHSLALLSLPFIGFGFLGLSDTLKFTNRISYLGLAFSSFGLIAAMIAGAVNGFALPLYISNVSNQEINIDTVTLIIKYGSFLNASMDYISILSLGIAIIIWSSLIIKNDKRFKWIGYLGFVIFTLGIFAAIFGFNLIGLFAFRFVVFGIVIWILITAYNLLIKSV